MDAEIGRLLAHPRLRDEDLLVSAIADHGESLGEHGERNHGMLVYDATMRVPWIVRGPGIAAGTRLQSAASQLDLLPTVLDLLGVDSRPVATAGRSFEGSARRRQRGRARRSTDLRRDPRHAPVLRLGAAPLPAARGLEADRCAVARALRHPVRSRRAPTIGSPKRKPRARQLAEELAAIVAADQGPAPVTELGAAEAEKLRSLGYLTAAQPKRAGRLPDPKSMMEVHLLLGEAQDALQRGESQAAVSQLEAVVARDPENLAALETQGAALARVGRLAEAEETFARALALDPGRISLLLAAAELRAQSSRLEQALQLATLAMERDPRSAEARVAMARFQQALGHGEAAAESARAAFTLAPHAATVEIAYAELVERPAGQIEQARQRLRDVVEREPLLPEGWMGLGALAESENDVEGAIAAYERGLVRQPAAGSSMPRSASCSRRKEGPEPSKHLRRAAELLQPTPSSVHRGLALLAIGARDWKSSERSARAAIAANAADASAWTLLAASLEEQSRPDDALNAYEKALRCRPAAPAGTVQQSVACCAG